CAALNLPQHLQKFDLYKPMHGMWESYMMKLIKVTGKAQLTSTLLSADLHGAFMFVAECKIESFTGVQGIMIRETSQTFGIITREDKLRVVPKKSSVFIIQLDCWKITLHGDNLSFSFVLSGLLLVFLFAFCLMDRDFHRRGQKVNDRSPTSRFVRLDKPRSVDDLDIGKKGKMRRWLCCSCHVQESKHPSSEHNRSKTPPTRYQDYGISSSLFLQRQV
ncbi:hypothetical protein F2Q69_00010577, partial [Brassica cretica]